MLLRRGLTLLGLTLALGTVATLALGPQRIVALATAHKERAGPQCIPSHLNVSDVLPGTGVQVTPLPDSLDAPNTTQISFLGAPASDLSHIAVTGSYSHGHAGRLHAYSQGDGASFLPARPFHPSETVLVRGRVRHGSHSVPFAFHFTVALRDTITHSGALASAAANPSETMHFHSQPELHPPSIDIATSAAGQEGGDIFVAPYAGPSPPGPMIFNSAGNLVWFDQLKGAIEATNLKVQSYEGRPVLSWWQGYIPPQGFGQGEEIVVNSSYQTIMRIAGGNGLPADLHEFRINPSNNTALLSVFDPIYCDIGGAGGPADGAVTDSLFQELDLKTHLVRREWHPIDHVALSHSVEPANGVTLQWPYDFFHINSVWQRPGGSFLISSRDTSAMYLIDGHSGQVVEQIGGPHGDTRLGPGTSTAFQHDAEEEPNGEITVFDNGGVPLVHPQSRALVLSLNAKTRTETLVAQYVHSTPLKSGSQGSMQIQPNGNVLVGWGPEPYVSEYSPTGALLWDAILAGKTNSYRAYRFPWTGTPVGSPSVAAGAGPSGSTDVYASWNGATTIASWRVLGGASPSALTPVGEGAFAGFETAIAIAGQPAYVAVQALDGSGNVLGTSAAVSG
ncbi:MAG TPA: arylsulfotransferase family protein [Solirubrobacteraceae bacterium]|nr:arylsulfotransferase family protein [Solirubrobacteraceae bacterium]